MSGARLALFIFLVAGALPGLLDLYFVTRKLRRSFYRRRGDFARCQALTLVRAASAAKFALRASLYPKYPKLRWQTRTGVRAGRQSKSLTAKFAKTIREDRKELLLVFLARFAAFSLRPLRLEALAPARTPALAKPAPRPRARAQSRLRNNSRSSSARGRGAAGS
jgi:hypothetical protein